jgi:hypothetical protein
MGFSSVLPGLCTADLKSISLNLTYLAYINPLNAELNPICHLLALLGAPPILHISRIRVKGDLLLPHSVSEQDGFKPSTGNSEPVKQLNSSGLIIHEILG